MKWRTICYFIHPLFFMLKLELSEMAVLVWILNCSFIQQLIFVLQSSNWC